jgi:hypothetical protein
LAFAFTFVAVIDNERRELLAVHHTGFIASPASGKPRIARMDTDGKALLRAWEARSPSPKGEPRDGCNSFLIRVIREIRGFNGGFQIHRGRSRANLSRLHEKRSRD